MAHRFDSFIFLFSRVESSGHVFYRRKMVILQFHLILNSIVFDDEEENKLEYTVIHKEFKKLAEGLIEGMITELGASPDQFAEAMATAANTQGYQKITKIIESIDDYQLFHKMMKKKNASLNEAALKNLIDGPPEAQIASMPVPTIPFTKGEETKTDSGKETDMGLSKLDRKTELKTKKEFGRLNTLESDELASIEKYEIELAAAISKEEQDVWMRKSRNFNP